MGKRVLVCGAGSIGRRHIANLKRLGAEVAVWRARADRVAEIGRELDVRTHVDLDEAIAAADAVVVATATDQHVPIAAKALEARRALFIEKPLSHSAEGIPHLVGLAAGCVVEVGCQLRAHPNLIALASRLASQATGRTLTYRLAMGHRLDEWRPTQDYSKGYSADGARGGGALFDLIHQIDVALWLFGRVVEVQAVLAKVGDLDIRGDDVANLMLTHETGATGHIQLDMASPVYRCEAEVMTTGALYRWSGTEGVLREHRPEGDTIVDRVPQGFERNDLFLAHMTHFLQRLNAAAVPPLCGFEEGVAALNVALAARKASLNRQMARP